MSGYNNKKPLKEQEYDAERAIEELKVKMSRLKFRLFDCQNQNQMLRKELLMAKKVIDKEISLPPKENFRNFLNEAAGTEFRGRLEKILFFKDKLNELQNRIKRLEDGDADKSAENPVANPRMDQVRELKKFQNKKMMDKELQYLLEHSCQVKRKLEVWKKRTTEQSQEVGLLRRELESLLEKSKDDRDVHESYHVVEKELRARQTERLDIRSKLDIEKTRNEQLIGELKALKEDISTIQSKINDDKALIAALTSQQGYLQDLLERQKLISESDSRRFRDDLREIQIKHGTNSTVLSHLHDVVEERSNLCIEIQEYVKQKAIKYGFDHAEGGSESTATSTRVDTEQIQQSERTSQPEPAPGSDEHEKMDEDSPPFDEEVTKLSEECEEHKNILRSLHEEINQLTNVASSNDERLNDWMSQLLQTRSLLCQKNTEIRELEETFKRLQKLNGKKGSPCQQLESNFTEEVQKKYDVLNDEYQFLLSLWQLLLSNKENSMEIYAMSIDGTRWHFIDTVDDLLSPEDESGLDEHASDGEKEEIWETN